MPLIYITGISVSGKSAVRTELLKRGYEAHGTDEDGIANFHNNETGEIVGNPIDAPSRTKEWREQHTWKISREAVEKLAEKAKTTNKPIFLCGVAGNDGEVWDLFSQVFALTLDEPTLRERLAARTNNSFGKASHELESLLEWQRTAAEDYAKLGATLIDATRPLAKVVDEILEKVKEPKVLTFADASLAKKITEAAYPNAEIKVVEHGYDNIVVLVDDKYALRFPRNQDAYARSQYEKQVLEHLEKLETIPVPRVLGEHDDPSYLITSFVAGKHLSAEDVRHFSSEQQKQLAEDVAGFAYSIHSLFSVEEARRIRKELRLDERREEPWDMYFERLLYTGTLQDPEQDKTAKAYYKKWKALDNTNHLIVVHDDLHTQNMLFQDHRLCGVLDFGDSNIGTAEQELRQLYRINESILKAAIDKYSELAERSLDIEAAKIWAIMQEIGSYVEHLANQTTDHPAFSRSARNLNRWFGTDSWGKGFDLEGKRHQ